MNGYDDNPLEDEEVLDMVKILSNLDGCWLIILIIIITVFIREVT